MAGEIISKRCRTCKHIKPLTEFWKNKSTLDGLQARCKTCIRSYNRSPKAREYRREMHRKYKRTPQGKSTNRKYRLRKRMDYDRVYSRTYRLKHPLQVQAQQAVRNDLRNGKLRRPDSLKCSCCGIMAQEYHHPNGYNPDHWLDVVPVCCVCHKNLHKPT